MTTVFEYSQLDQSAAAVKEHLYEHGFVVVRGVPDFVDKYRAFLVQGHMFLSDPAAQKECDHDGCFSHGWKDGQEQWEGKPDSFKGSFYGDQPDALGKNVWPSELHGFRRDYLALTRLLTNAGHAVLNAVDLSHETAQKSRFLRYGCVTEATDDGNPLWCGSHLDHGYFTCLCPAQYYDKDGKLIDEPEGAGLFVRGQKVVIPDDCVAFQVGEAGQLVSNGQIQATEHCVRKAYGCTRITFVTFMNLAEEYVMRSTDTSFGDRFRDGMTYGQWAAETFARHAATNEKKQLIDAEKKHA